MLSERRIEANRRNAQKSTGPRTPEGKAVCSQNASRHRHLADIVLLACEDRKNFIRRCRRMHREFQPDGPVETVLVNEMVAAMWRRDRASILEARLLDHAYITTPEPLGVQPIPQQTLQPAPDAPAPRPDHSPVAFRNALAYRELTDTSEALPQLSRDSARHNRDFHRALATLERRRAARRKRNPQPEPNSPQTHRPTEPDRNGGYDRPILHPPADPEFAPIPAHLVGLLGFVSAPEIALPDTVAMPQEPMESTVSTSATPPSVQSQPYSKADVAVTASPATLNIVITPSASSSTVDVSAKLDPFEVLPDTPSNSIFGIETPLAETPRFISVVPAEMLARYDIRPVNDLVTASCSSFTGSYFGVPGALFIGGEADDNSYRGFRRVEYRGNYATPVGDAEELEIVKGPQSPISGGGPVGGFLNYTPKSARSSTAKWLEHPTGKISLTYGSYDQKAGSVEFGSPFKLGGKRGGFYTFFSVEDSKSYYKGISTRSKLGQISFDMELPSKWRMEFGMQGFAGALPRNIGWNRDLAGNQYNLNQTHLSAAQLLNFADLPNYASTLLATPQAALFALDPKSLGVQGRQKAGHHEESFFRLVGPC